MSARARVAIVGGGVYGAAIAYELAKEDVAVTLVERDAVGAHASGTNPGNLNPLLYTPAPMVEFALACFHRHGALARELAALGVGDYALAPVRRALLCFDEAEREALMPVEAAFSRVAGFAARWVDGATLRATEPRLSSSARCALVLDGNRSLDPRRFTLALVEGATRIGARLVRATVREVAPSGGGYVLVTEDGREHQDAVVLACGPWATPWLGADDGVEPLKGELLRLRLRGANVAHDLTHGSLTIYRRGDACWVGGTQERAGLDARPSAAGRARLLEAAARILPAIADAEVLEHVAALRPMSPDGQPRFGRIAGHEHAYFANGGGHKGMLTAVGVARAICELIVGAAPTSATLDNTIAASSLRENERGG